MKIWSIPDVVENEFENSSLLRSATVAKINCGRQHSRRWFDQVRTVVESQRHRKRGYFEGTSNPKVANPLNHVALSEVFVDASIPFSFPSLKLVRAERFGMRIESF